VADRAIDIDVEDLARCPTEPEDWAVTIVVGGIAPLLSFPIVSPVRRLGVPGAGCTRGHGRGNRTAVFEDWGPLLGEGFLTAVVGLVYRVVPVAAFAVGGGSIAATLTGSDAGVGFGVAGLLGGPVPSWLLALAFGYVGLAGTANYAGEGTLGAGFDLGAIADVVTSRDYPIAWAIVVVLISSSGCSTWSRSSAPSRACSSRSTGSIAGWLRDDGFVAAVDADGDGDEVDTGPTVT
jgi:hypothetical protein